MTRLAQVALTLLLLPLSADAQRLRGATVAAPMAWVFADSFDADVSNLTDSTNDGDAGEDVFLWFDNGGNGEARANEAETWAVASVNAVSMTQATQWMKLQGSSGSSGPHKLCAILRGNLAGRAYALCFEKDAGCQVGIWDFSAGAWDQETWQTDALCSHANSPTRFNLSKVEGTGTSTILRTYEASSDFAVSDIGATDNWHRCFAGSAVSDPGDCDEFSNTLPVPTNGWIDSGATVGIAGEVDDGHVAATRIEVYE